MSNLLRACCLLPLTCISILCLAQRPPAGGVLTGLVADPSGAVIPHATIHIEGDRTHPLLQRDTTTDAAGRFTLTLPPGTYTVTITSAGFDPFVNTITTTGAPTHLNASLIIATHAEEITVPSHSAASTSAADNRTALNLDANQLQTFSSDNATFQKQILALAGGYGEDAPQIFVNGFTNGLFPPKDSIREIRINHNPYSAQYDSVGFGRVEVFTKPGSNELHGSFQVTGNDNAFNATAPYTTVQPPYHVLDFDGTLDGPIGKKTSFFLTGLYNDDQGNAIVNALTLNSSFQSTSFLQAVPSPETKSTYTARLDRQLSANNTFIAHYEFDQVSQTNSGVGLLVLPTQGANTGTTTQSLQLSNTQTIGANMVSETRFQYIRTRLNENPVSSAPEVIVEGAFNGGGDTAQSLRDNQDSYEFQEYFSLTHGSHFLHAGGRYRLLRDANLSTSNYNGQFTFPSLSAYQQTLQGVAQGATQFNITAGNPSAAVLTGDLGIFAEDEWKLRKNLTLDYGLRIENQSPVPGGGNLAPRLGFAWGIGQTDKKPPLVLLRGGGGIFYSRFASTDVLTAIRQQTGTIQPQYYVENPTFYPNIPSLATLSATPPTLYNISPNLHADYTAIAGISAERTLGKLGNLSVNYTTTRGVHEYLSRNTTAPLPGTSNPPNTQNIYQFSSDGLARAQRIHANLNLTPAKALSMWAFYVYGHQLSDTTSSTTFPSNQYNLRADYGLITDPSQRFFAGGSLELPFDFALDTFLAVSSGQRFNITTGTDLNGDTIYNDRPAFATSRSPSTIATRYGTFDPTPVPGETLIPANYGLGPTLVQWDLSLQKSFRFGASLAKSPSPSPGLQPSSDDDDDDGPDLDAKTRYTLVFAVDTENILNHMNSGTPVGVLSSQYFGQSISLNSTFQGNTSASRVITLRMAFQF